MLLIIYGAAAELGDKCRKYLQTKGYGLVDKYYYTDGKPIVESRHESRTYLSKDEFLEKTDSLFRYEVANCMVGFNWNQICDAIYGNKNKLLTRGSADISMLRKIKEVYKDKVQIIYCYVDTATLEKLCVNLSDMTPLEYGYRMGLGLSVKENYSENIDLFDSVIIYSGESSVFDYKALYHQIDTLIGTPENEQKKSHAQYDIFISYYLSDFNSELSNNCYCFIKEVTERLEQHGIKTYSSEYLKGETNFYKSVTNAIMRSSVFIPILTEESLNNPSFQKELQFAVDTAKNNGLIIKPIAMDSPDIPSLFTGEYSAYNVSSKKYLGSIDFIEDWFVDMFSGEETLKRLSEEIDMCINSSLYKKAFDIQRSYICILENHLARWHKTGTIEKLNALIKYLDLAVKSENYTRGSTIIDDILSLYPSDLDIAFANKISSYLVKYCELSGISEKDIIAKIHDKLKVSNEEKNRFIAVFNHRYNNKKQRNEVMSSYNTELSDKIVAYSKASIELFETLFESGCTPGYNETLISAYNRIIDYCRQVCLSNEVTEICVDRITKLKMVRNNDLVPTENGKKTLQSLKVYLGQALPETGHFDVFISHKSADDMRADKIYNHLKLCGYEVFCDHHTLSELHDSNYDKRVTAALQNSKHLILVSSDPEYVKDQWVYYEWHMFFSEKRENRRNGNLIMVLSDDLMSRKAELPAELRDGLEIIKMSEFRDRISKYLW